jgi:hypothetical protein
LAAQDHTGRSDAKGVKVIMSTRVALIPISNDDHGLPLRDESRAGNSLPLSHRQTARPGHNPRRQEDELWARDMLTVEAMRTKEDELNRKYRGLWTKNGKKHS